MRVASPVTLALALALAAGCSSSSTPTPTTGSVKGTATLAGAQTGNRGIVIGASNGGIALTDDAGHYEIDGVAPGMTTITAEFPGYASASTSVAVVANQAASASALLLAPTGDAGVDMAATDAPAQTGGIKGKVTLGQATGNAGIVVGVVGGPAALTDDAGSYSIDGLAAGDVTIQAQAPGYVAATAKATVAAGSVATVPDITLQAVAQPMPTTGGVSGTVTLGGATSGNAGILVSVAGGVAVTTDDAGHFTINGVTPGMVTLEAQAPGYIAGSGMATVVAGKVASAAQIDLQAVPPPAPTSGTITGTATLAGATTGNAGIIVAVPGGAAVATDDAGNYTLTGVQPGSTTVAAQYPGYVSATTTVTVVAGKTATASGINLMKPVAPTLSQLGITAVSPANASTVGNDAITITGTGFDGTTTFSIGGATARLGKVTATSATLYTPPSAGAWGRPIAITAVRGSDGASASNSNASGSASAFAYYAATFNFQPVARLNSQFLNNARVPLVGDVNGDGAPDIVGTFISNAVYETFLNSGNGDFVNAFNLGTTPSNLGVQKGSLVDLDNDGKLDMIVADESGTWQYALGDGTGRFDQRGQNYYQVCSGENSPVGLHLSSSTLLDVAIVCENNNQVRIWSNKGSGSLGALFGGSNAQQQQILNTGGFPTHLVVTDLNQDGKDDLVVVQGGNNQPTLVWYLQANGALPQAQTGSVGNNGNNQNSYWGACADLNGDKFPDCVVGDLNTNTVRVFLNDGKGALQAPQSGVAGTMPVGQEPRHVSLRDLNGDGLLDLFLTARASSNIQILPGRGDGTFGAIVATDGRTLVSPATVSLPDCRFPWSARAADFDGDGALDLVGSCEQNDRGESQFGGHIVLRNVSR